MKKIAILAPYVGTINRGAETFVIELTRKLSSSFDIDVYTLKSEPAIEQHIHTIEIRNDVLFNLHNKIYSNCKIYRKLINRFYYLIPDVIFQKKFSAKAFMEMQTQKYDLVFPNNGVWGAKFADKYRMKNHVPFLYTGHGGIGLGERYIIETNPNAYVCLTQKHLSWATSVRKGRNTKLLVIPNGVCVDDFYHIREKRKKKTILSVAALTDFKRHELTIKAISKIPNVNLVILGKGEEEKKLRELADTYLSGRCVITSTSYSDVKNYYSCSDLFVLPSKEEPFGIAYLEAMASNIPIVAPDDSQRREIIADAGLYCNVEDSEEYAETIKKALIINWENKPLERARLYDWNRVASKYGELINQIIDENKELLYEDFGKTQE